MTISKTIVIDSAGKYARSRSPIITLNCSFTLCLALSLAVWPPATHAAESTENRVDRIFAAYEKPGSPGCALGVIRDGRFIYRKGYGAASLELGVPISSGSVFYMASVSKQFTAASVLLAAEQGFLSLDDDVRKYIPELPDYGQQVTLRQMLHHTSGFRDYFALLALGGRSVSDVHPADELIDLVARQKALNNQPGAQYLYSNSNYLLLAEVIKRATKKSLAIFTEENIFRPLGMTHTRFYDDNTVVVAGRAPAYEAGADGTFRVAWSTNFEQVGSGGLMSSIDDMLLWDRNFYLNHLGSSSTFLKDLQTRGVLNDGTQTNYALGLVVDSYRGLPVVAHAGESFGYRTEIIRFPEQRFTVLCLCNVSSADTVELSNHVADVYLAKDFHAQPPRVANDAPNPASAAANRTEAPHLNDAALSEYVGTYTSAELSATYKLAVQDGTLTLRIGRNPVLKLDLVNPEEFESNDLGRLRFHRETKGRISGFSLSSGPIRDVAFEKELPQA